MRKDHPKSSLLNPGNPLDSRFFEVFRESIVLVDPEGIILDCNPAALDLFGYAKDEMIGMTGVELSAVPDDWHRDRGGVIDELVVTGSWQTELPLRTKDGKRFWGSLSITAYYDEYGDHVGNVSLFRDETASVETKKAREFRNSVFSQMSEGVVTLDQEGRILDSNTAAEHIFQRKLSNHRGENLIETIARTAGWRERVSDIMENLSAGKPWASGEGVRFYFQPDRVVSVSFTPFKNEAGNLSSILMMIHDITVLSEALERVREREASLKQTQRIARCGSWIFRQATEEIWCSEEAYEVMGYQPDGKFDMSTLIGIIHKEDRRRMVGLLNSLTGNFEPLSEEYRIVTGGGKTLWVRGTFTPYLNEAGEALGILGVIADVNLDNMVDTFYRADLEGRIILASPSVKELLGYTPDEITGQEASDVYVNKSRIAEFQERLQSSGGEISDFDAEIYTKDGGRIWVSTNARYWKDANGNILGLEGTIRNVTPHKIAEETLRQSQKMEAVGQLTGGIAHDYNNMLGVIIGNIQLVQGAADLDDKSRQRLDKALAAAQRNAELTAKLLGLSRAQPLGTTLTFANDCISGLEDIIAKSLTASIEVKTHLSKDLWLADIDPAELEDTILNLAINARDAMPNGGILVVDTANKVLDEGYVSYNPESHVGDYVVITMSDTGAGMSTEIREKIFDPFFSTKEAGKGTGLGLSMVYAFVQRSGGFIKVYSEPGEGTTFRIFLPRAIDRAESSLMPDNIADSEPARGSETILVVDDEEFLVDLAVTQLEDIGYRTLSADNGEKALEILKADPDIDLLFTDIIMPGKLDGYDLALAARQVHPALKILLTSGFAKQREKLKNGDNETLTRLAANLLSKPYMLTELATAVRYTLDKE